MPDFDTSLWFGLLAPSGTPRHMIDKLADAAPKQMQTPQAQEALRKQGFEPLNGGPEEFADYATFSPASTVVGQIAAGKLRPRGRGRQ